MRYSITSLLQNAFQNHKKWPPAWRSPELKSSYDVIIVGGGGHGLAAAYYLAKKSRYKKHCCFGKRLDWRWKHRKEYYKH